jgi:asparagine synthetase B (glutamine-hydrolysing)
VPVNKLVPVDPPELPECRRTLEEWRTVTQIELAKCTKEVDDLEDLIETFDDALLVRGYIAGGIALVVGTAGAFVGIMYPWVGAGLTVVCSGLGADAIVRGMLWFRNKKEVRLALKDARKRKAEWEADEKAIDRALHRIELEERLAPALPGGKAPQLPAGSAAQLPAGSYKKKGKAKRGPKR